MKTIHQDKKLYRSVVISKYKYTNSYQISKLQTIKFQLQFSKENTQKSNLWAMFFLLGNQPFYKIKNSKIYCLHISLAKILLSIFIYIYNYTIIAKSINLQKVILNVDGGFIKSNLNWKIAYNHFFKLYLKIEEVFYASYIIFYPSLKVKFLWEYNQIFL
jgi:hypothetical protein